VSIVDGILNQTLTSISSTTRDGYGRVVSTELYTSIPCRFQSRFDLVLDKTGQESVSKAQIWIKDSIDGEDITVDVDYICVYGGINYTVMAYEYHYNLMGEVEYIKLYLR